MAGSSTRLNLNQVSFTSLASPSTSEDEALLFHRPFVYETVKGLGMDELVTACALRQLNCFYLK